MAKGRKTGGGSPPLKPLDRKGLSDKGYRLCPFCSGEISLTFGGRKSARYMQLEKPDVKVCVECNQDFIPTFRVRKFQRFCCKKCGERWHRRNRRANSTSNATNGGEFWKGSLPYKMT